MVDRRRILIATGNLGKVREMQAILSDLPVELVTLADGPPIPQARETGDTFEENAALKALYYAGFSKCWTLADDSGLEVDALDGQPGVYSSRYAGADANDAGNNAKLIAALRGVPESARTARFRCAMALAFGDTLLATSNGTFEGVIIDEPRGDNGFGYDPHFLIPARGKTAAELPPEEKNRISHRGQALAALRPKLERLIAG